MDLKIEEADVRKIVQGAVAASLGKEKIAEILSKACEEAMKPRKYDTGYGSRTIPSVLEEVFNDVLKGHLKDVVEDLIKNDPAYMNAVRQFVVDAWQRLVTSKREDVISKLTQNFWEFFVVGSK